MATTNDYRARGPTPVWPVLSAPTSSSAARASRRDLDYKVINVNISFFFILNFMPVQLLASSFSLLVCMFQQRKGNM